MKFFVNYATNKHLIFKFVNFVKLKCVLTANINVAKYKV